MESTDPRSRIPVDSGLNSATVSDDAYLEALGYKGELSRVLGRFSSFALQYSTIGFSGALLVGFTIGLSQVGPASVWVWFVASGLQVLVAMCVAELCSAYPLAGGAYLQRRADRCRFVHRAGCLRAVGQRGHSATGRCP